MTRDEILAMEPGRELDAKKQCTKCKRVLPLTEFGKNKKSRDGLQWNCRKCISEQAKKYIHSPKGKETKRRYFEKTKDRWREWKKDQRRKHAEKYPEKIRARHLIGNAVRRGYIPKPEESEDWYNRWEFHHPDYSRPYYGVWLRIPDHRKVDLGIMPCPPCTDYTEIVKAKLLVDWGLENKETKAALLAVMGDE